MGRCSVSKTTWRCIEDSLESLALSKSSHDDNPRNASRFSKIISDSLEMLTAGGVFGVLTLPNFVVLFLCHLVGLFHILEVSRILASALWGLYRFTPLACYCPDYISRPDCLRKGRQVKRTTLIYERTANSF